MRTTILMLAAVAAVACSKPTEKPAKKSVSEPAPAEAKTGPRPAVHYFQISPA